MQQKHSPYIFSEQLNYSVAHKNTRSAVPESSENDQISPKTYSQAISYSLYANKPATYALTDIIFHAILEQKKSPVDAGLFRSILLWMNDNWYIIIVADPNNLTQGFCYAR